jgi:uncharacterized protein YbbC (DUF1343 family)
MSSNKFVFFFLFVFSFVLTKLDAQISYNITATVGAERFDVYLKDLQGKRVGIVANQTSLVRGKHLVDLLLEKEVDIKKVFAPEHGFRGAGDAGEHIKNDVDEKTGLPIISLYGNNKKPTKEQVQDLDVIIFDIQDVGVRFYTYISTMHYVMESCQENDIKLIVLDRPNPNGFYVDGPVLNKKFKSFVGLHPVPLVHGMTVGEYAKMINGEGWLNKKKKVDLKVVKCLGYTHSDFYRFPIKPSPNLPNMSSVFLYPSLGLFEGTVVSVGRGTKKPFQMIGHPDYAVRAFSFTPESTPGAKNPPHLGKECFGHDLAELGESFAPTLKRINLGWLIEMYNNSINKDSFFNNFFNNLAGNDELKEQIIKGMSEDDIRKTWQADLNKFMEIRAKYLLYKDF